MNSLITFENGQLIVAEEVCKEIAEFYKGALKIKMLEDELKENLLQAMEENNISTFENSYIKVAYKKPSTRKTVDSKKLKEELPDIYDAYTKESNVKSSISLEAK